MTVIAARGARFGGVELSKPKSASDQRAALAIAALRPSEYTAALIQVLQANARCGQGAKALEIGSVSGLVLAARAAVSPRSLSGLHTAGIPLPSARHFCIAHTPST